MAIGFVLPSIILSIHCCHLRGQPLVLILKLSDHSMQPLYSGKLRDVVCLIFVLLLMLVVMLIMLIMRIMLVITNIISHVRTLTPCGDHSTCIGVVFDLTVGANILTSFLRVFDNVRSRSELFVCSFDGGPAREYDTQIKTLFYSSMSKKDQLITFGS